MKLTVFTPVYNRALTLGRLFESLLEQNCRDFEWLIIDDGSTDGSREMIEGFQKQADFPVRCTYKKNGGKHTAYNLALQKAKGDWFLCVDSDDLLAQSAVADILEAARGLPSDTGIAAYKTDLTGKRLSDPFPEGLEFAKIHALELRHGCKGEFTFAFPTALARQFPFPVFEAERFVTESVVYDRIDSVAEMKLLPKIITVCEYQADGYSANVAGVIKRNPNGYCLYFLQRIDLMPSFLKRLVCAGKYWAFRWIGGNKRLRYRGEHAFAVALALPLGLIFRVYYRLIRGI